MAGAHKTKSPLRPSLGMVGGEGGELEALSIVRSRPSLGARPTSSYCVCSDSAMSAMIDRECMMSTNERSNKDGSYQFMRKEDGEGRVNI